MRKLIVFNSVTLDGYFVGNGGDMAWAHQSDPEWLAFTSENAAGGCEAVYGRVTYQMMAGWWPSPNGPTRSDSEKQLALAGMIFSCNSFLRPSHSRSPAASSVRSLVSSSDGS